MSRLLRCALACACLLLLAATPARAALTAEPLAVLDTRTLGSLPSEPIAFGGRVWVVADDGVHGRELHASVAPGLELFADLLPGGGSSSPAGLAVLDGALYFAANDADGKRYLWRTDGTTEGTEHVALVANEHGSSDAGTVVSGSRLFFFRIASDGSRELMVTDGDSAPVALPAVGTNTSSASNIGEIAFAGGLLFRGFDGELWFSDGTSAETRQLQDLRGEFAGSADWFAVDGDTAWYVASDDTGAALWRVQADDLEPERYADLPPGNRFMAGLVAAGGRVAVLVHNTTLDERELWRPGGDGLEQVPGLVDPHDLVAAGADLYVAAEHADRDELFHLQDGPIERLTGEDRDDWLPGLAEALGLADGSVVFRATDHEAGTQPARWSPADGIEVFADESAGPDGSKPTGFTAVGDGVVFSAFTVESGHEPHALFDGEVRPLGDVNKTPRGEDTISAVVIGETVWFDADSTEFGRELFRSDGTQEGTEVTRDIVEGTGGSNPLDLVAWKNRNVLFTAETEDAGRQVFVSEGAPGHTGQLTNVEADDVFKPFGVGDRIFYFSKLGGNLRLHTTTGAMRRGAPSPIDVEGSHSDPWFIFPMGAAGDRFVFTVGLALWISDGTQAGTKKVTAPGGGDLIRVARAQSVGDALLVASDEKLLRIEPDGTAILLATLPSPIDHLLVAGGKVFATTGGIFGAASLYVSDGTAAGTRPVPLGGITQPARMAVQRDHVVFVGTHPDYGREVFRTDGTAAGTGIALDTNPGTAGGFFGDLTVAGDAIYTTVMSRFLVRLDGPDAGIVEMPQDHLINGAWAAGTSVIVIAQRGPDARPALWIAPPGKIKPVPPLPGDEPDDGEDGEEQPPAGGGGAQTPAPGPAPAPPRAGGGLPPATLDRLAKATAKLGTFRANRRRGTGTLTIEVPRAGTVKVTGPGIGTVRKTVKAGTVKLAIKPGRALARKLRRDGRARVRLRIRYVPQGGAATVAQRTVTLVRR